MGKLRMLPGVNPTVDHVLHYALDNASDFKHVIVIGMLNDDEGHVVAGWSTMDFGTLTFMERILHLEVTDFIQRNADDE